MTNFFRYTAREFDTETNLYYYRARYLVSLKSPLYGEIARFLRRAGVEW